MKTALVIFGFVFLSGSAFAQAPAFPSIDTATQVARDSERRRILQGELATEEKALAGAQSPDDSARHKANIAALKAELSRLQLPGLEAPGTPVKLKAVPIQKAKNQNLSAKEEPVPFWDVYRRDRRPPSVQ